MGSQLSLIVSPFIGVDVGVCCARASVAGARVRQLSLIVHDIMSFNLYCNIGSLTDVDQARLGSKRHIDQPW